MSAGSVKENFESLYKQLRAKLLGAPYKLEPDFKLLTESAPYRDLVSLGPSVLPLCLERLEADRALFLNAAIMEIWQATLEVPAGVILSENEIAEILVTAWKSSQVTMCWSPSNAVIGPPVADEVAVSGNPSTEASQNRFPNRPILPLRSPQVVERHA